MSLGILLNHSKPETFKNIWIENNSVISPYSNQNWYVVTGGWDGERPRKGSTSVTAQGLKIALTDYGQYWATKLDTPLPLDKIASIRIEGSGTSASNNNTLTRLAIALIRPDTVPGYKQGSVSNALKSWNGQNFASTTFDVSDLTGDAILTIMGCTSSSYNTAQLTISNLVFTLR